jgi:hypothetical protein
MSVNVTQAYSAGVAGIGSFRAWRQEETYQFFILQFLAVAFALLISFRDARDKKQTNERRR